MDDFHSCNELMVYVVVRSFFLEMMLRLEEAWYETSEECVMIAYSCFMIASQRWRYALIPESVMNAFFEVAMRVYRLNECLANNQCFLPYAILSEWRMTSEWWRKSVRSRVGQASGQCCRGHHSLKEVRSSSVGKQIPVFEATRVRQLLSSGLLHGREIIWAWITPQLMRRNRKEQLWRVLQLGYWWDHARVGSWTTRIHLQSPASGNHHSGQIYPRRKIDLHPL